MQHSFWSVVRYDHLSPGFCVNIDPDVLHAVGTVGNLLDVLGLPVLLGEFCTNLKFVVMKFDCGLFA